MTINFNNPRYFLGVDGGGTKTSAWVGIANFVESSPFDHGQSAATTSIPTATSPNFPSSISSSEMGSSGELSPKRGSWEIGEVLGRGEAGPGNPKPIGFEAVFENLRTAIDQALEQARQAGHNLAPGWTSLSGACFGLAGVGRPEEKKVVQDWLESLGFNEHWIVTDDIEPIRWAAQEEWRQANCHTQAMLSSTAQSPWDQAVSVIAGTGSIAQGHSRSGMKFRAGGWGYMLGDEGSGFSIALSGLRSICYAHDQRLPLQPWQTQILEQLQLPTPEHLIGWIYQVPIPRRELANLAEIVLAARHSDPVASKIADESVKAWKDLVVLCCEKINVSHGFGLALTGGVPNNAPDLVEKLLSDLKSVGIEPANHQIISTPVLGCLAMAAARFT